MDVSTQGCALDIGADGRVVDFQFLGANMLLILWAATSDADSRLVVVPTQSPKITYGAYSDEGSSEGLPSIQLTDSGLCWSAGVFAKGDNESPVVCMEVLGPRQSGSEKEGSSNGSTSGATASGVIGDSGEWTARVCLMHADGKTHRVLSLPSAEEMFGSQS